MAIHLGMLIAYDADGSVCGTLDYLVQHDDGGTAIGLVDCAAHEEAGGEMTDIWTVSNAAGSKVWPEWIGARAHDFRVELVGPPGNKRIAALVHKTSGHRRERAAIEAAIDAAPEVDGAKDIRRIVGGPDRPLPLDDEGRTIPPAAPVPPTLPIIPARKPAGVTT